MMTQEITNRQIFLRAREMVQQGWVQCYTRVMLDGVVCRCASGAIRDATAELMGAKYEDNQKWINWAGMPRDLTNKVMTRATEAQRDFENNMLNGGHMTSWNDSTRTYKGDVVEMFEAAINAESVQDA